MTVDSRHPLYGAHKRLERANYHIQELRNLADDAREDYEYVIAEAVKQGQYTEDGPLDDEHWTAPEQFSLVLGETVQHLRSALEYLAYEMVKHFPPPPSKKPRHPQFPINHESAKFTAAVKDAGLDHFEQRLEGYQPYPQRPDNSWLRILRVLSNQDKHRMLQPAFAISRDSSIEFGATHQPMVDNRVAIVRSVIDDDGTQLCTREPVISLVELLSVGVLAILLRFDDDFANLGGQKPWYLATL